MGGWRIREDLEGGRKEDQNILYEKIFNKNGFEKKEEKRQRDMSSKAM